MWLWQPKKGILKRQTKNHIIYAIWSNLDENQAVELKKHINLSTKSAPWLTHEDILIEFALLHPDLRNKVFSGLTEFFKDLIKT